jgi:hypothetical protein
MNIIEQKEIELQDKIDDYLKCKMSSTEKMDFEKLIATDTKLKQKVDTQKLIVDELKTRAAFIEIVNNVKDRDKRYIQFRHRMTIAWSAAAIFIGVFFINNIVQNSRMDSLYSVNYSTPQANMMRGNDPIEQATNLLENNKPKQAKEILEELYKNGNSEFHEDVRWYLALTELKLHNKINARKYLTELKGSSRYGKKADEILKKL